MQSNLVMLNLCHDLWLVSERGGLQSNLSMLKLCHDLFATDVSWVSLCATSFNV